MIKKLLIANRGEIARRVARTCRSMGIVTVAVCSDPDLESPIASEADEVVHLPGRAAAETYLAVERILDAALRTSADAVHPGYGFLAESSAFAQACVDAGLVFLGPPPSVIERMGSKLDSKSIMEAVGVPVLRGIDVTALGASALREAADEVGWPVLVKASAGGGGRGIRHVRDPQGLVDAVEAASREAEAAFGDATVLVERFVEGSHHVEVQVVADMLGTTVHLFERECSIQRRYQKIIEESPSPAIAGSVRSALVRAAVDAARAVGYVGVGTVEFLVAPDGEFFFLEMNTRLQVEHPVTEAVTGIDLVRVQILVGEGSPLPEEVLLARQSGHAIEARLYAEDPDRGYAPTTGRVNAFSFVDRPGIRVDSAVVTGTGVSPFYDGLLAKVIAWAPSRPEAIRLLGASLRDASVHGIVTNRELLTAILESPRFARGDADTSFLDDLDVVGHARDEAQRWRVLHAGAGAVAAAMRRRAEAPVLRAIPAGWRSVTTLPTRTKIEVFGDPVDVEYLLHGDRYVQVDGHRASVVDATENEVLLDLDGVRTRFRIRHVDGAMHIAGPGGAQSVQQRCRFPSRQSVSVVGSLSAPMPGTVIRLLVDEGSPVQPGTGLLVIEAMKMEHTVVAPEGGSVAELCVAVGAQVEAGTILAVIHAVVESPR